MYMIDLRLIALRTVMIGCMVLVKTQGADDNMKERQVNW